MNIIQGTGLTIWIQAHPVLFTLFFTLFVVWNIFWTGLALWHSAKRSQFVWFFIFLIVHTLGILEIIYLFGVLKLKFSKLFA